MVDEHEAAAAMATLWQRDPETAAGPRRTAILRLTLPGVGVSR